MRNWIEENLVKGSMANLIKFMLKFDITFISDIPADILKRIYEISLEQSKN